MMPRNFVYVGDPIPPIDSNKNTGFICGLQKAMLLSLVKRKLLTTSQMEQVLEHIQTKDSVAK